MLPEEDSAAEACVVTPIACDGNAVTSDHTCTEPFPAGTGLADLRCAIDELTCAVREQGLIQRERERVVDRLHAENQVLRRGELQAAMAPLHHDLITLHDDLERTAARYENSPPEKPANLARDLHTFRQALEDILARYGVERYHADLSLPYNPREHRAVASVPTDDPTLDRCIAQVIRCGFRTDARVVRPLEAVVMKCRTPQP